MLSNGDLGHEGVANLLLYGLPHAGYVVLSVEERVFFEHNGERIGSRLDVLIQEIATGDKYVIDVKTKRGAAFKFLDEAKPSDEIQVQLYIAATDSVAGFLVYADREGQNGFRVFRVERDDSRPQKAVEILQQLRDGTLEPEYPVLRVTVSKNKGDDSIYLKDPWQMDWCDLKECRCSKAYGGRSPDGIVAKVSGDEGDPERVVSMKADVKWTPVVVGLLEDKYPDTTFSIKE